MSQSIDTPRSGIEPCPCLRTKKPPDSSPEGPWAMEPWGFEPQIPPCHGGVIPFHYGPVLRIRLGRTFPGDLMSGKTELHFPKRRWLGRPEPSGKTVRSEERRVGKEC